MKKILSILVASVMLVAALSLCVSAGPAAPETTPDDLWAEIVNVAGDGDNDLYVVFSEPVKAPTAENKLSLVAYGWPAAGELRYGTRDTMTTVVAVSDTVWKFTLDGHKTWMLSGDISNESPVAVDGNDGGYWSFVLFGTVTSKDGKKTLDVDDKPIFDNSFAGDAQYGFFLTRGWSTQGGTACGVNVQTVASVDELPSVLVRAFDYTEDNAWIYLVFSEPVTLGDDFRLAMFTKSAWGAGTNDFVWLYQEKSDVAEKVDKDGKIWKVGNDFWQKNGDCSLLFDPTESGYFMSNNAGLPTKLVLQGTVQTASGKKVALCNKDDACDNFGSRFHNDMSGSNYGAGFCLNWDYFKVSAPVYSPATADMTSVVAAIAVVALAGVAIVCKKH